MSLPPEVNSINIPQPGLPTTDTPQEKPPEKSRQCPICKVFYKYGNSYWQHVRYVHANFLSQCIICGKSYKRTTMAKQHVLHFHKIAWHLCGNYVRKVKKNDQLLQNKLKEKSVERRKQNLKYFKKKTLHLITCFNCYDCPGTFPTMTELFAHVKVHKNEKEVTSEEESCTEDVRDMSAKEMEEIQNGLVKEIEDIENGTINEAEDAQNSTVNEVEDVQNGLISENEEGKYRSASDKFEDELWGKFPYNKLSNTRQLPPTKIGLR